MEPDVEIYTKTDCPYCEKATDLFDAKDVAYETYNVTGDEERFAEMKARANGRETAPEVFVDDELIGGWDDTSALDATGELDERLGIADDGGDTANERPNGDGDAVGVDGDVVEHRELVVAGTGLGHVSSDFVDVLDDLVDAGTTVVMTSQCLGGRVCDRVYDTGRDLLDAGVIEGEDLLPSTAKVKLMWALANADDPANAMRTPHAGDLTGRSVPVR